MSLKKKKKTFTAQQRNSGPKNNADPGFESQVSHVAILIYCIHYSPNLILRATADDILRAWASWQNAGIQWHFMSHH